MMTTHFKNLLYEVEKGIAIITFNRPDALNAMNTESLNEFQEALRTAGGDDQVRCIILTGAGEKAFVAGADIKEMKTKTPVEAMACDVRFASENARFGQPEILLGIIPGWGGTQRLPRLIGEGRAFEFLMTGEHITAQRAYEMGLVNKVCSPGELLERAKAFALKLAGMPGFAIKMLKTSVYNGLNMDMTSALHVEIQCICQCFSTDDQKEGMNAFIKKRKPVWKGR